MAAVCFIPDVIREARRLFARKEKEKEEESGPGWKDAADLLMYRKEMPDVFVELDRRSIMALLRTGLAGSLLTGLIVFYYLYWHPRMLFAAAGLIMLFNTYTAARHIKYMQRVTLEAAQKLDQRRPPE